MSSPLDRLEALMREPPAEYFYALDAKAEAEKADPNYVPTPVAWREDEDPFGMDWAWIDEPDEGPRVVIREQAIAAWIAKKFEPASGGLRIAADEAGDERAEEPLIHQFDRPRDAPLPACPNVFAPMRIQEQLVIPDLPPDLAPGQATAQPLKSIAEAVSQGSLFYLEFATAHTPSAGTAVVVRVARDSWRLLWEEITFRPNDGTSYFGPIRMESASAEYLVILADASRAPLLATVSASLPGTGELPVDAAIWKPRLSGALAASGHAWFAIQRIEARPSSGPSR